MMRVAPAASAAGAAALCSSCPAGRRRPAVIRRSITASSPAARLAHPRLSLESRSLRSRRPRVSSGARRTCCTGSSASSAGGPLGGSSVGRQLETAAAGAVFSAEEVAVEEKTVESDVLPLHPGVVRGELENGLRYVLLSNPVAPQRFEAHLEIHAGSIDEREDEQGLAHLVEHTVFLGSRKRERLLGTGSRSNAYTDFHHTVFHIHAPVESGSSKMLPIALEALEEIGFDPAFLQNRIDKEKRAVLAEAQMMNTIEYRIDCQLLEHLHAENALGYRFPIGKEELIHVWQREDVMAFHNRYYYPGNATLYVVGDISTEEAEAEIRRVFSGVSEGPPVAERGRKARSLQPPVQHLWSAPGLASLDDGAPLRKVAPAPHIFQHPLVEAFQLSIFAKLPVEPVLVESTLRTSLMCRIVLAAFQFRMSALAARYTTSPPPFAAIELDHSDSGREGCAVTTLNIIAAEPGAWREAVIAAVKAVAWLHRDGLTKQEADRFCSALLADSEQLALQTGQVPHLDNLEFIMESDALGHAVMDQVAAHVALTKVAETIDLESINEVAKRLCEFIVEYKGHDDSGVRKSTPAALVSAVPSTLPSGDALEISSEAVTEAIIEGLQAASQTDPGAAGVAADVPEYLMDEGALLASQPSVEVLMAAAMPREEDEKTGVVMMQMANGMKINYRITANEPGGAMIRLVVPGGRARETMPGEVAVAARALSESGRVGEYTREQVELFCMASLIHCTLEVDDEFVCMDMHLSTGGQLRSSTGEEPKGMTKALQLMHLILSDTKWDDGGLVRAKQFHQAQYRAMERSLEKAAASKVMRRLLGGDFRFQEPNEDQVGDLGLEQCSQALDAQLIPEKMELSMVGDFDPMNLRKQVVMYMGTLTTRMSRATDKTVLAGRSTESPVVLQLDNGGAGGERMHLADSDDRACAFIAGAAPNRWGGNGWGWKPSETPATDEDEELEIAAEAREIWHQRRMHPLYTSAALSVLAEVINARLFTTVRDSLGLTYDVSFRLNLFDRLCAGWWTLSVTSTPTKIEDAASASRAVLAGVGSQHPTKREVARARRTLIARHESDLKDNAYWIGLLTHLQSDVVPMKDLSAIRDLPALYAAITPQDLIDVYEALLTAPAQTFGCIAVAGSVKKEGQESIYSI